MLAFSSKDKKSWALDSLGYMNSLSLLLLWNPWTSAGLKRGSHYSPPSAKTAVSIKKVEKNGDIYETRCDLSMESRKGWTIIQRPLATKIISFLSYSMGSRNGFEGCESCDWVTPTTTRSRFLYIFKYLYLYNPLSHRLPILCYL